MFSIREFWDQYKVSLQASPGEPATPENRLIAVSDQFIPRAKAAQYVRISGHPLVCRGGDEHEEFWLTAGFSTHTSQSLTGITSLPEAIAMARKQLA